ncbi:MAG: ATP-dependent sacrificial sulfur transferase LarE [Pirellulaceae bacterium]
MNSPLVDQFARRLIDWFAGFDSCVVAFSGGVDSSVVAKAAHIALGERATAVTASSASVSANDLEIAGQVAGFIGIRHEVMTTAEINRPGYVANAPDRCFHCKSELYTHLTYFQTRDDVEVVVNGANLDDLGDHRPGMQAARDFKVRSPLIECEIDKSMVRELANLWNLSVWDRPASPCLASRIAYGVEVTPERLKMVEQAESLLRQLGLPDFRVRYHEGDLARLEVPLGELPRLAAPDLSRRLVAELTDIGFKYVTLDLGGLRSGSLNQLIQLG